ICHIFSGGGIQIDHKKTEVVKNWPRPLSSLDIRSFLGLTGYYKRFVEVCEKSFQELKDRLTSTPVLTLSERSNGFVVYYDASRIGLGCILMQNGKIIAYALRQLKIHKKKYPTHDLELENSLQYVFKQNDLILHQKRWHELLKGMT
ncbi:hypothetical protein MTR67_001856, partial [Solanum verrucosum]